MQSWKCSMDEVQGSERARVWSEALQQISLPSPHLRDQDGFHGDVSSIVSPLGIHLSRVSSSAQTLSGRCHSRVPYLWLALPVKGEFQLGTGAGRSTLRAGDILYGPAGYDAPLELPDHFVMLYVRIPQTLLHPRLLNLKALPAGTLTGSSGVNRIFSALLHSLVDELEQLDDADIHPVEVAVSEFVVSSLAMPAASSFFDLAGAGNFKRICQAIELSLGDGTLALQDIADQQRVSSRYIQKLFQQAGLSFGPYLRQRRLAHCRADLANPALRGLSISDICFRWGFNDAAHFSRSFRAGYGVTPREFRQAKSH